VTFSPQNGAKGVSLSASELYLFFSEEKQLGTGTVTLTGVSTKGLRIPYVVQKQLYTVDGLGNSGGFNLQEINISRTGAQNEMLYSDTGSLPDDQIGIRDHNSLWLKFLRPLRPETVYTIEFDSRLVVPAEAAPKLTFSTQGADPTKRPNTWSFQCDPWKLRPLKLASDYSDLGAWDLCPVARRSLSGCGDFEDDPRNGYCAQELTLSTCDDYIFHRAFPSLWPKRFVQREVFTHHMPFEVFERGVHVCFNVPIGFPDPISELRASEFSLPPTEANHRDNWAKYGEYSFIPHQRWLHNAEHGPAIFLYDGCLRAEELCQIRDYIHRVPSDGGGKFRWILSSWRSGQRQPGLQDTLMVHFFLFVVTYSNVLGVHCFDETTLDWFLTRHYREAYEDLPMDGFYTHLHQQDLTCRSTLHLKSTVGHHGVGFSVAVAATAFCLFLKMKTASNTMRTPVVM